MTDAHDWARRLAAGGSISEPMALVVAHPDDETLFAGTALARLHDLHLILVTDGAPHDMADARRLGFATRDAYAAARGGELTAALAALGARARVTRYDLADQGAAAALATLTDRLADDLAGAACVMTHPYEGGHPDHDAVSCAVARAAARMGPGAPAIVEFACYASFAGERRFWRFVDDPACPVHRRPLVSAERARLETALAAHGSQASVFGTLRPEGEQWRAAPAYDYSAPPPGEACLYDGYGWTLTSARWRALAAAVQ